jgi:hypothetical protein
MSSGRSGRRTGPALILMRETRQCACRERCPGSADALHGITVALSGVDSAGLALSRLLDFTDTAGLSRYPSSSTTVSGSSQLPPNCRDRDAPAEGSCVASLDQPSAAAMSADHVKHLLRQPSIVATAQIGTARPAGRR